MDINPYSVVGGFTGILGINIALEKYAEKYNSNKYLKFIGVVLCSILGIGTLSLFYFLQRPTIELFFVGLSAFLGIGIQILSLRSKNNLGWLRNFSSIHYVWVVFVCCSAIIISLLYLSNRSHFELIIVVLILGIIFIIFSYILWGELNGARSEAENLLDSLKLLDELIIAVLKNGTNESDSLEKTFTAILKELKRLRFLDSHKPKNIFLFGNNNGRFKLISSCEKKLPVNLIQEMETKFYYVPEKEDKYDTIRGIIAFCAKHQRSMNVPNVATRDYEGEAYWVSDIENGQKVGSLMCIPIIYDHECLAVISIESDEIGLFDDMAGNDYNFIKPYLNKIEILLVSTSSEHGLNNNRTMKRSL